MLKCTEDRYATFSIALHWLMFILMVGVYAFIELRELFPKGSDPREAMKALHFMLGLSVLVLILPRLIVRLRSGTPAIVPAPPAWQRLAAKLAHLALYLIMLGMPVLGWLTLSAAGKPIPFYGFELPALLPEDKALGKSLKELHATIGELGYFLIGLHIIAALFHHYKQRDNTLVRMLPAGKSDTRTPRQS
ncbi:cytochrome b [Methylomonas rivi]|uniref:Cytochrome b n=1 Tax=Methylomonas rivi TaxID=2952226 RepID=A0ABT1U1Q1_9GAMM|nr:cytochrome b [Methylomonas sp. WSC-6]MCQ8127757.1 cytochrome b [Methylomonas sp. WSC-6]